MPPAAEHLKDEVDSTYIEVEIIANQSSRVLDSRS